MKGLVKFLVVVVLVLSLSGCSVFLKNNPQCKPVWEPSSVVGVVVLGVLSVAAAGLVAGSVQWNEGRTGRTIPAPTP